MRTEAEVRVELAKWDAVHEEHPDDDTVRALVDALLWVIGDSPNLSEYED